MAEEAGRRGYRVGLHYYSSEADVNEALEAVRSTGTEARAFRADLRLEDEAAGLIGGVLNEFGRIDLLVNCAAHWAESEFGRIRAKDVLAEFEANALSTFLCSQKAGMEMVHQDTGGVIITIGDWAISRPYLNYAAYFISKGCIPVMTRVLAAELAEKSPKIRVNCILPGPVMVPDTVTADEKEEITNRTLLQRLGTPENVAQAVFALAENDYITGACLPVDGGRTIADGFFH